MMQMNVKLNPINSEPIKFENNKTGGIKKTVGVSIVTCLVTSLVVGIIGFALGTRYTSTGLDYSELNQVYSTLKARYNGTLDDQSLLHGAASGMASAAGDPYTSYFTKKQAADLTSDLSGTFEGIGAELGQNSDKQLEIVSPLDGSPAKKAGLLSHDVVVGIDGQDSTYWAPEMAVGKIRGEAGTNVKLSILRSGEMRQFTITRDKITVASVTSQIKDGIGYMRISTFGDDTSSLAAQAAKDFKQAGVKGIILDLRGNGGGYVDTAKSVSSLWLDPGSVVVKEMRGNQVIATETASGTPILKGIKTVVLIDGGSASASEIVAGALRDHGVATLVGKKSYGKGSVQELIPLSSGAQLKVTIAKWYTPNDKNIDGEGITPDTTVEMTSDQYNAGNDTQRARAIEIINQ